MRGAPYAAPPARRALADAEAALADAPSCPLAAFLVGEAAAAAGEGDTARTALAQAEATLGESRGAACGGGGGDCACALCAAWRDLLLPPDALFPSVARPPARELLRRRLRELASQSSLK